MSENCTEIRIGRTAENEARVVRFNVSDWQGIYGPGGAFILMHQRPNEDEPYICQASVAEDGWLEWVVKAPDLQRTGRGQLQLSYVVDEQIAKSTIFTTRISRSLDQSGELPEPYENMIEELIEAAADIVIVGQQVAADKAAADADALKAEGHAVGKQNGEDVPSDSPYYHNNAKYYAEQANGSAQAAAESAGKASTSQGKAEDAQTAAETAQGKAEDAQTAAETAQGKAEDAQTAAETAQGKAEDAQTAAETAQGKAEAAQEAAEEAIEEVEDSVFTFSEMASDATATGWRLNESNGLCASNASYKLVKYPVTAGDIIKVISDDRFQFQTVASVPSSGTSNRVGSTYGSGTFIVKVPNTATYLIISTPTSSNANAYNVADNIDNLNKKVDIMSASINNKIDYSLKAYIVETKARNFWVMNTIPTAFQTPGNYVDEVGPGNPFFKISGSEGDDFVTVETGGNASTSDISSYSNKWAAVISYDGVNYEPCIAWYVDSNTIGVWPPLKDDISDGELGSQWYDDLHLTRRGYIGFAQAIFNANPKHCEKKSYIAKWVTGDTKPFTEFGGTMYSSTDQEFNYSTGGYLFANQFKQFKKRNSGSSETTGNRGIRWEVITNKKTGYVEIMLGGFGSDTVNIPEGYEIYVDMYEDGVLKEQYVKTSNILECICMDYANADKVKIEVYLKKQAPNGKTGSGFRLSSIYFWENQRDHEDSLFPKGVVVGQMFDSWGVYHDSAFAKELARLISNKTGVTVPYNNHSDGGRTSAWGKAWFYENLQKYNPAIGIVNFGINDANSMAADSIPSTVDGPDGTSYDNKLDKNEYAANMQIIADEAKSNGIQMIMTSNPRPLPGEWYYALVDNVG